MSDKTNIAWTDASWNPIVGCSIVSPGCTNCYAQKMAHRIQTMEGERTGRPDASHYFGTTKVVNGNPVWTGLMRQAPEHILLQPLKWRRPRKIFVNSMSDLFHENVPDEWIDRVFAVMALCPQHTFQVLTKRSKRMQHYLTHWAAGGNHIWQAGQKIAMPKGRHKPDTCWPLPNVWLGVSCEDQQRADERVPDLLATPAAVRFVSAEPLLGPIEFKSRKQTLSEAETKNWLNGAWQVADGDYFKTGWSPTKLDWIIVGGESGPGHRPMQIEWAEAIRQQCEAAGTAFFFKQDSGAKPGQRGRASDALWACKQFPEVTQ